MKLNLSLRLDQEVKYMNFNFKPSSYAINSRTLKVVHLLYIVQTRRNIWKLDCNSHTHLTETPSFAWTSQLLSNHSVICFSAHKQWPNCSIVHAYQNQPESTKILITFMIKEDSHYKVKFPSWVINITIKTKHAVFPWELKISPKTYESN